MTQVVNGYLRFHFERFDTAVISSRDGSRGIRAVLVAASAAFSVLRLRHRDRSVVVVHLSERGSFVREGAMLLLASLRGFATVAHLHGSEFAEFATARPKLVGRVLRAADMVISLSEESSEVAARFVAPDAVRLVPNAVDSGVDRAKEQLVVFGGAVRRRKGVDVLTEAWSLVVEAHPDHGWRLMVAGPVIEPDLVAQPLPEAEFLGALDHEQLMELLERSRVAVLPSRDEAMPMFILEAMARDNMIVSTPVGGIPAVLGGGVGELVPVGDAEALAAVLGRAVTDAAFRDQSAARARAAFEADYSASAVFPVIEGVWGEAIERRRTR